MAVANGRGVSIPDELKYCALVTVAVPVYSSLVNTEPVIVTP